MKRTLVATLVVFSISSLGAEQEPKSARPCVATAGRVAHAFQGEASVGELYERRLGRFIFRLSPDDNPNVSSPGGWHIGVYESGRTEDLSQFTPPYAGPNPRAIFAWFDGEGKALNLPGKERTFFFSPEVGRSIQWEDDSAKRRLNTARIYDYGRGDLDILDYRVGPATLDMAVPPFKWIKFAVCLTWSDEQ